MNLRETFAWSALVLHFILVIFLVAKSSGPSCEQGESRAWHGGHPIASLSGSCWCGEDKYCMCNPSLAIDLVLTSGSEYVWLVRRKDTGQLATMGGFVDVGETTIDAVSREMKEETGLDIPGGETPRLLGIYGDPRRDNRRHTTSAVYTLEIPSDSRPQGADDVKDVVRVKLDDIGTKYGGTHLFADHLTILLDYKESILGEIERGPGELPNLVRSTCDHNGGNNRNKS